MALQSHTEHKVKVSMDSPKTVFKTWHGQDFMDRLKKNMLITSKKTPPKQKQQQTQQQQYTPKKTQHTHKKTTN